MVQSNSHRTSYRPDIDGLRAIAVVAVVLYHAFPAIMPGGYVGVDVFFVVSGYLIAGILLKELETGTFSLRGFWMRRVRRLFPAAAVVLATAVALFWNVLNPDALIDFGQSLLAQLFFVSNFFFWKTSSYFDIAASAKPLLHTWSLSVEEQFYMFFPLLLWLVHRYWRRGLVPLLVAAIAVSLALSVWGTQQFVSAAFYLLPFRAWELGIGVLLATLTFQAPRVLDVAEDLSQGVCAIGLGAIIASIFLFDDYTPFPSWTALAPTVGTALLIAGGSGRSVVASMLRNRSVVFVGKISYSLYLWHWVVLTYLRNTTLGEPHARQLAVAVVVSFALAAATYFLIECPTRRNKRVFSNPRLLAFSGAAGCALLTASMVIDATDGFRDRLTVPESEFARSPRTECLTPTEAQPVLCDVGDPSLPTTFVAIGDSHTFALLPAFNLLSRERGMHGLLGAGMGCLPLIDVIPVGDVADVERCAKIRTEALAILERGEVRNVILAARWAYYYTDESPDHKRRAILMDGVYDTSIETSRRIYERQLRVTLERMAELGVHVYIIDQVPHQLLDPRDALLRAERLEVDPNDLTIPYEDHLHLQEPIENLFSRYDVEQFSIDPNLCSDERCQMFTSSGEPLYSDDDHLSRRGALFVAPALASLFDEIRETSGRERHERRAVRSGSLDFP